jgi:hypothetical protein
MMEAILFSEMTIVAGATCLHILEDGILQNIRSPSSLVHQAALDTDLQGTFWLLLLGWRLYFWEFAVLNKRVCRYPQLSLGTVKGK